METFLSVGLSIAPVRRSSKYGQGIRYSRINGMTHETPATESWITKVGGVPGSGPGAFNCYCSARAWIDARTMRFIAISSNCPCKQQDYHSRFTLPTNFQKISFSHKGLPHQKNKRILILRFLCQKTRSCRLWAKDSFCIQTENYVSTSSSRKPNETKPCALHSPPTF